MNWYQVRTKWPSVKYAAHSRWDRLTRDEVESIAGDRERLVDKLQEQYGYLRSVAEREADRWARRIINGGPPTGLGDRQRPQEPPAAFCTPAPTTDTAVVPVISNRK